MAAGDGIVLVDTGMHEPGSMMHLQRALDQARLRIEHVKLIVCTHAHVDHCGQAPAIAEQAGCEVWMHEAHAQRKGSRTGQAGTLRIDRELTEGDTVATDLGEWRVIETPGHAPSHICLYQPERRLLVSGDHVLGRVALYFETGHTPDPVQEFLHSLDKLDGIDARLALAGHGRPFTDVPGHVSANRSLVETRLQATLECLARGPKTAYAVAEHLYGDGLNEVTTGWLLDKTHAWLAHLERRGLVVRRGEAPECWERAA